MRFKWYRGSIACFATTLAIVTGLTVSANAQTVLVDLGSRGSFRGVDVPNPDPNGNFWNSLVPGLFYADLIDVDNNATTIDFGFSTPVGTDSFNGPAGVTSFPNPTPPEIAATDIDAVALGNLGVKEAAIDFASSPGGVNNNTRFEIQGLDSTKTYTLTLFGSHKFSDNDTTVYSVFTDNTYATLVDSASLNVQEPGAPHLHNRDTVATISNLTPQAGNVLYVQFVGAGGGLGYLNDFQITAVPEPGAVVMLIVGLVGLLSRRHAR